MGAFRRWAPEAGSRTFDGRGEPGRRKKRWKGGGGIRRGGGGCADGAVDAEGFHQGLGAMVACADGYAEFVEEHSGVVMVGFTDKEGY